MFEFGKIDLRPYLDEVKKELEGGVRQTSEDAVIGAASIMASAIEAGLRPKEKVKAKEHLLDFGFENSRDKLKQAQVIKKIGSNPGGTASASSDVNTTSSQNLSGPVKELVPTLMPGQVKNSGDKGDGTRTILNNKAQKDFDSKVKGLPYGMIAVFSAIIIASVGYRYSSLKDKRAKMINPLSLVKHVEAIAKDREPAQIGQSAVIDTGNIILSHYDKQKMQVFIDGKKVEVDPVISIKVPLAHDFTLRVQIEGKKHFVKEMRVDNSSAIEVEIPEMSAIAYGYVNTASNCAQGEIRFEIYGEKRVSSVPMVETFGIAFPLGLDDRGQLIPIKYQLFFKKKGEDIERKIEISLNREDQTVDLCDQL
jgi:serine/threonine-protein kinase